MSWGYQDILGPKNHTRKIDNFHKDFELYKVFMRNFLYQYYLLEDSTDFDLEILRQFGIKNHEQKSAIFTKIF